MTDQRDVTVLAPTATISLGAKAPSPGDSLLAVPTVEELYQLTWAQLKQERAAVREVRDMAAAMASLCLSMTRLLIDKGVEGGNTVVVPKAVHDRMVGASVEVTNLKNGDVRVRIVDNAPGRIHVGV